MYKISVQFSHSRRWLPLLCTITYTNRASSALRFKLLNRNYYSNWALPFCSAMWNAFIFKKGNIIRVRAFVSHYFRFNKRNVCIVFQEGKTGFQYLWFSWISEVGSMRSRNSNEKVSSIFDQVGDLDGIALRHSIYIYTWKKLFRL